MVPIEDVLGERANITVLRLLTMVGGSLSGNEIARRVGIQQSTARKALERLVARGIVTRTDIGRAAAYDLNSRLELVKVLIFPLFRAEAELRAKLWADLVRVVSRLDPSPLAAIVYGSVARGERAPRDLDLLLVTKSDSHEERLRESLLEATEEFATHYQLDISPLFMTRSEVRDRAQEGILKSVVKEGILLFGEPVGPLRRMRRWQGPPEVEAK